MQKSKWKIMENFIDPQKELIANSLLASCLAYNLRLATYSLAIL